MIREPEPALVRTPVTEAVPQRWPTFLRLDRPELDGNELVIPAGPDESRARTRTDRSVPFAYLYEAAFAHEPDEELRLAAGRFDETAQTWSFTGDITGLIGLTEPTTS